MVSVNTILPVSVDSVTDTFSGRILLVIDGCPSSLSIRMDTRLVEVGAGDDSREREAARNDNDSEAAA